MAKAAPEALKAMRALNAYIEGCGLEKPLLELVKIRASQINGCAFCLKLHIGIARKLGENEDRLFLLNAWRETPLYTERERAALAWTEALTRLGEHGIADALYQEARRHFTETELVNLSVAISLINGWNRLMVAFAVPPDVPIGGST
jgi:AhpD family alkylhydroperoxidase